MLGEPERATLNDFDAILDVVNTCFPHQYEQGGMLARWPHCYIRDANAIRHFWVIRDGKKPVSLLEYVDHLLCLASVGFGIFLNIC